MICAVIFDIDGVLFDTEPLHRKAWMETMRGFGHDIPEESLMKWTGVPCPDLAVHYQETLEPRNHWELYHDRKGEAFRDIVRRELVPFVGLEKMIAEIGGRIPIGFATSNMRDDAELMLEVTGLADRFSAGVAYDDCSRHKPDPEPYLSVASRLGVVPGCCAAIEDSPTGVEAAARAGLTVAAVSSTFGADAFARADKVFATTVEACEWLLENITDSYKTSTRY